MQRAGSRKPFKSAYVLVLLHTSAVESSTEPSCLSQLDAHRTTAREEKAEWIERAARRARGLIQAATGRQVDAAAAECRKSASINAQRLARRLFPEER